MIRFDHLAIPVSDPARSRDWYVRCFGFEVEFEIPERGVVALRDEADFTIFLNRDAAAAARPSCVLTFQVDDVERKHDELRDPDGYLVCLWDERTMSEKGGAS